MNQLIKYDNIAIDANLIIYYCFKTKETRIIEFTDKTHKLIDFLINHDTIIQTPKFIINEINRIDFAEKIDEMITNNQLTQLPKDNGYFLKMKLEMKIKHKLYKLQQKDWFIVEDYVPSYYSLNQIRNFFLKLINHPKIKEFLDIKKKNSPVPSFEDMALLLFSKDKHYPIITNDHDLSFFEKELLKAKLSDRIYHLSNLDIYN